MNKSNYHMKNIILRYFSITAFISTMLLIGCVENKDSSGLEYMPDMYRSPAIEPYVDYAEIRGKQNPDLANKLSSKIPPLGTIPYYGLDTDMVEIMMPYFRNPSIEFKQTHGLVDFIFSDKNEYELAINDTINPIALNTDNSKEIFDQGKTIYTSMCAHCHGEKGDGNGPMVQSGAYSGVPAYGERKDLSEGQLFYSIYYGKGAMGAHGSLINKKEIWTLVHYIRKFQNPEYGKKKSEKKEDEIVISDVSNNGPVNEDTITVNNPM